MVSIPQGCFGGSGQLYDVINVSIQRVALKD